MVTAARVRLGADRCPGALELHEAADGPLARVRVPGGLLGAAEISGLGELATRCAAGTIDITSRGNVQLRGVHDADAMSGGLGALGLLPSVEHDRARNYSISPLTGLGLGTTHAVDARPMLRALDAGVLDSPGLAGLPGRFLIHVDDGSATAAVGDVGLMCTGAGWRLALDGCDAGAAGSADAIDAAKAFLLLRGADTTCWRIRELAGGATAVARLLGRTLGARVAHATGRLAVGIASPTVVVAAAWLQRLDQAQTATLADLLTPQETLRLAPAGRLVLPTESTDALAQLRDVGLVVDPADHRAAVTTCSGRGACARAEADVHTLALELRPSSPVHLVACPRGCGPPDDAILDVRT